MIEIAIQIKIFRFIHRDRPRMHKSHSYQEYGPIWDGIPMLVWLKCDPGNYDITGTNTLVYL